MQKLLLSKIKPDPAQPRQEFAPNHMMTLKASIKQQGILIPLLVEKITDSDSYLLVDGERRYTIAKELKMKELPVNIVPPMSSTERMIKRFHLQEQHQNWTPFDKARAIYFFMEGAELSAAQVAEMLGLHTATVYNWVGILKLSTRSRKKALSHRLPFSYLNRIVRMTNAYSTITDMPSAEIETKLIDKIAKYRSDYKYTDLSKLLRFLTMPGFKKQKLEYLNTPSMTIRQLLGNTPAGLSIDMDYLMYKIKALDRMTKARVRSGAHEHISLQQIAAVKDLVASLNSMI